MLAALLVVVALIAPVTSIILRRRASQADRRGDLEESVRLGRLAFAVRTGWIGLLTLGLLVVVAIAVISR